MCSSDLGGSPAKGIDGDDRLAQFRNPAQQGVGQHPNIRPRPLQQIEQDHPLDPAKGVIGDDNEGPLGGNPPEFLVGQVVTYGHALKNPRGEIALVATLDDVIVDRGAAPQALDPFEQRSKRGVELEDVTR